MILQNLVAALALSLPLSFAALPVGAASNNQCQTTAAIPGDYPDPSVIRVGDEYFATATTSDWAPIFPILKSTDLKNWETVGAVFTERPKWTVGQHWAPEIVAHEGDYYIYYTARKENGPLCVAVAKAKTPQGPYQDHGPLVCEEVGSIDGVPFTDEHGVRHLIWKEDGNSVGKPTPFWIQKLSSDGTRLVGEKREILKNDTSWEGHLIEGPFIMRRNGYFYLFYAANACCGVDCNYAAGVARSKSLHGPYEKHAANPILKGNSDWKCPGHGSIVQSPDGRDHLLYHAYSASDSVYVGRQALLAEVKWTEDGWPTVNDGNGPVGHPSPRPRTELGFFDGFDARRLAHTWQWPQSSRPQLSIEGGLLRLKGKPASTDELLAGVVAQASKAVNYRATVSVLVNGATAGLSAYGNSQNAIGISIVNGMVQVWKRQENQTSVLESKPLPSVDRLMLRMISTAGFLYSFSYSVDGTVWKPIGPAFEGEYLPPWDLGVRIALTAGSQAPALIDQIAIEPL